jgi:hypothetical protein
MMRFENTPTAEYDNLNLGDVRHAPFVENHFSD